MRCLTCLLLLLPCAAAHAFNWHVPQPWRASAVIEGRSQDYGDERFLHLFSYRHQQAQPGPLDEGVRGTAGSVDSDTLYYDFRYLQHFRFDDPLWSFSLDVQRSEDFDGSFDRQLVGLHRQLGKRWQASLRGDVFADKAESDIYLGGRYLLDSGGWLALEYVLPDAYFNDKTATDTEYLVAPQTWFLQAYVPGNRGHTLISANLSPSAEIVSFDQAVRVDSRQQRLALQHWYNRGTWQWRLDLAGEVSERRHRLAELAEPQDFDRTLQSATLSLHWPRAPWQPHVGLHYLKLKEKGWFGRALNDNSEVVREEPVLFTGLQWQLSDTRSLAPTLYLSQPRVRQQAAGDWKARQEDEWIGKLSLPWQWIIKQENGAVLTLTPSFRLHRLAFGGGNLQLHWPL